MVSGTVKLNVQTYSVLGLIPFLALGALFPLWPEIHQDRIQQSFAQYAAIILAFMAGALWLPSIIDSEKFPQQGTTIAILLSLIAFLAMLLPTSPALVLTACGFLLLLAIETFQSWMRLYPGWYGSLRIMLTSCVVFCHLLLGVWLWL